MSDASRRVSLEELETAFQCELEEDKRYAAETAYALAFRYRNEDVRGSRRFDIAKLWAIRAIELLDEAPADTLEQVASARTSIGGVDIPGLLHSCLVRSRLADVLI